MNYKKIYDQFIADRRIKEKTLTGYSEKHHIIPRSLGGDESDGNLIRLNAGDHYFAHLLLAKAYGGNQWAAVWALSSMNNKLMRRQKCLKWAILQRKWIDKVRENYAESARGVNNGMADKKVYRWVNVVTGEKIKGTRHDVPCGARAAKDYFIGKTKFAGQVWFCLELSNVKNAKASYKEITNYSTRAKKASLEAIKSISRCYTKVKCVETGKVYPSQRHAAQATGAQQAKISEVCNGKRNKAGGYGWVFA